MMSDYFRSIRAISTGAAAVAVLFGAAACGGDKSSDELQAAQRDVGLAPPSTPALLPPPSDVPVTPVRTTTPTKSAPRRAPVTTPVTPPSTTYPPSTPPGTASPAYGVIASGSEFAVRPASKVCTNTQKVGDRVTAIVSEAVTGSSGASIPAGATAELEVTKSQFGNNDKTKVALDFRVVSVTYGGHTYEVEGNDVIPVVTAVRRQSNTDQAKKVAIGAAAGAVVGRVLGGNTKSTVVGGAIGAVGGAATAAGTADYDGCVAADSRMTVRLTQDLRVRAS
jgi:hypothetical protein